MIVIAKRVAAAPGKLVDVMAGRPDVTPAAARSTTARACWACRLASAATTPFAIRAPIALRFRWSSRVMTPTCPSTSVRTTAPAGP